MVSGQWSIVKLLRQATNGYPPSPAPVLRTTGMIVSCTWYLVVFTIGTQEADTQYPHCCLWKRPNRKTNQPTNSVIHVQAPASQAVFIVAPKYHGASRFKQAMPAWSVKTNVLRLGIVGMRGSMGVPLRPCMIPVPAAPPPVA